MTFPFESLRRRPDVEGPDLVAADAADRLLLDESAAARADVADVADDGIVVIGDAYGALTLAALHDGASTVRVHQDALTGEHALAANAAALAEAGSPLPGHVTLPLSAELVRGARLVLLRLPRSLDALADIGALIAAHADPEVVVFAGGRIKHMTPAMNDVLRRTFARVDVSRARQKSRVLVARGPHGGHDPHPATALADGIRICAFGGVFAGARLDIGTRLLLAHLPERLPDGAGAPADPLIDLACGTGVVAAHLALTHPESAVLATDQSAAAVASASATMAANGVSERVAVVRDDGLHGRAAGSASFIALNPPFHSGAAVSDRVAPRLFQDAARALRSGGELWCVWNSSRAYRGVLERIVGPTRQVARNNKFTVTVSTRP